MSKFTILLAVVSFSTLAEVSDQSHCREFLQPSNPMERSMGMMGNATPFPMAPFTISSDGRFLPKNGVNYQSRQEGREQVFTTNEPAFIGDMSTGGKTEDRPVRYEVLKDEHGNLLSVKRRIEYTQSDLSRFRTGQASWITDEVTQRYQQIVVREGRELNEDEIRRRDSEIEARLETTPLSIHAGNSVQFSNQNGKCFPASQKMVSITDEKSPESLSEMTTMDTALCRDINQFLKENPEATACFKKDLNSRMRDVFFKYSDTYKSETQSLFYGFGMGGYGFSGGFGGYGIGFGGVAQSVMMNQPNDISAYINGLPEHARAEQEKTIQDNMRRTNILMGSSPIIRGQQMLQQCFTLGLEPVINDEDLWAQREAASRSSIQANSGPR